MGRRRAGFRGCWLRLDINVLESYYIMDEIMGRIGQRENTMLGMDWPSSKTGSRDQLLVALAVVPQLVPFLILIFIDYVPTKSQNLLLQPPP